MSTDAAEYGASLNSGSSPKLTDFSDDVLTQLAASLVSQAAQGRATPASSSSSSSGPSPPLEAARPLLTRLQALEQALEAQRAADHALVATWLPKLAELATCAPLDAQGIGAAFKLAQYSGYEATPAFELTLQLLLSASGDGDLASLNPHLSLEQRAAVRDLALAVLLASTREAHAGRALAACRDLAEVLHYQLPEVVGSDKMDAAKSAEVLAAELILKADTLAGILLTERHTVAKKTADGGMVRREIAILLILDYSLIFSPLS